ncbi:hypothetical protein JCM8547_002327 [Rhodosporidiobolus lusitaniae]
MSPNPAKNQNLLVFLLVIIILAFLAVSAILFNLTRRRPHLILSRLDYAGKEGSYRFDVELNFSVNLFEKSETTKHEIKGMGKSGGRYNPKTHLVYRLTQRLELNYKADWPIDKQKEQQKRANVDRARRISGAQPSAPHDVRFSFPHARKGEAELWAQSDMLSKSSSYFKAVFSSEFAEAVPAVRSETRLAASVKLDPSAYSTYSALLVYLQSDFIEFCPLTSSFPTSLTHAAFIATKHAVEPFLPLSVSPKSIYRLADLLDLPGLKRLSFEAFRSSLSVKNAAQELFSDTSPHTTSSTASSSTSSRPTGARRGRERRGRKKMREIEAGELPEGAPVVVKLLSWTTMA